MKRALFVCAATAALSSCAPEENTNACSKLNAGDLVITEVMIDPEGTDTGNEWFEIFNTLGQPVDLKGLTVFLTATDGTGAKSHVVRAGTAPGRGYFTFGDVRSGPNPAWIGYSYNNALGSFSNTSGVVGVRCGQKELGKFTWTVAGKAGRSRQLDGTQEPSADRASVETSYCDAPTGGIPYNGGNLGTPGAANAVCTTIVNPGGGTCLEGGVARPIVHPAVGDIVISEVHGKPMATSSTNGEWVELNARNSFDLNDLVLATTSGASKAITSANCLAVNAGDYVLLARNGDATINGNIPAPLFVYGTLAIADTGPQSLTLSLADAGVIDVANFNAPISGRSWELDPTKLDATSNDNAASFCRAQTQWVAGSGDYGTPGAVNEACPADAGVPNPNVCFDDVAQVERAIRTPNDGDLVITEWHTNPKAVSDTVGEFIEVMAKADVDLNGTTLFIRSTSSSTTGRVNLNSTSCISVAAGGYLLFARNDVPEQNGGLPHVTATFSASLTANSVFALLRNDGGVYDEVTALTEVDGKSTQVAPGFETPADNDLTQNRCESPTRWSTDGGGDYGSPGAVNPPCATPADPNQCLDEGTQAMRAVQPPADGAFVITEWMTGPNSPPGAQGEYFEALAKTPFDLNGLKFRINTGTPVSIITGNTCKPVAADSYVLFGRNADPLINGNLPTLTATFSTALTGTSVITILNADGGVHDSITADGETAGASRQVRPDALTVTDNDIATNRCVTPTGNTYAATLDDGGVSHTNRGTPGRVNVACP